MWKICTSPLLNPPGKRKLWLYLSHTLRVFGRYGYIRSTPGGFSIDMAIFVQSPAGFAWKWPYLSNPRRVFDENDHIRPIPVGFSMNMAIFVQFPPGFQWIWPYSSNPRRVFSGHGHIHPILAGFSVNMTIFAQSPAGFAWKWPYSSNPRRVSHARIQILRVTWRGWVSRKDIHPKTCQVSDTPNKWDSIFWSVQVGAYCIRPSMYRV